MNIEKVLEDSMDIQKLDDKSLVEYFQGRIRDGAGYMCPDVVWARVELLKRSDRAQKADLEEIRKERKNKGGRHMGTPTDELCIEK